MISNNQIEEMNENNNDIINNKLTYSFQEHEKVIKFYLMNDDNYYIFVKNQNEIKIISCIELSCLFTLYHHNIIQDFIITPKTNS
jgi:hypothetical protein